MMEATAMLPSINNKQRGAVLFVALVFLVIITLISITAMRSSTLELRMAGNEQEQRRALESAQSAVNGLLTALSLPVTTIGNKECYTFGGGPAPTGCTNTTDLAVGPGYGTTNNISATLDTIASCPAGLGNSEVGNPMLIDNGSGSGSGSCAYFTIESNYDDRAGRGAVTTTVEGYIKHLN
jgi:Tfp pilus assembly protein PilX